MPDWARPSLVRIHPRISLQRSQEVEGGYGTAPRRRVPPCASVGPRPRACPEHPGVGGEDARIPPDEEVWTGSPPCWQGPAVHAGDDGPRLRNTAAVGGDLYFAACGILAGLFTLLLCCVEVTVAEACAVAWWFSVFGCCVGALWFCGSLIAQGSRR